MRQIACDGRMEGKNTRHFGCMVGTFKPIPMPPKKVISDVITPNTLKKKKKKLSSCNTVMLKSLSKSRVQIRARDSNSIIVRPEQVNVSS